MANKISRRAFLKTGIAVGAGIYGLSYVNARKRMPALKKLKEHRLKPGLVIAHGNVSDTLDEPAIIKEMVQRALNALGGMDKLISKGNRVIIKPNIAWNQNRNSPPIPILMWWQPSWSCVGRLEQVW